MTSVSAVVVDELSYGEGLVAERWTIQRPEVLNAINADVLKAIDSAGIKLAERLQKNPSAVRALVLRGSGQKAFVAGADIAAMKHFSMAEAQSFSQLGHRAFARLEQLPIPTVAAVHGFALGGGLELASACDVIFAHPSSQFGQPEPHLGLIPGFGGTARFVERLGMAKGLELLYSGRRIPAAEALALGLVQRVSAADQNFDEALNAYLVELTAKSSPLAIRMIKEVARSANRERIQRVCELEIAAFSKMFASRDKDIGIDAFLNKKPPAFVGS